MEMVAWKLAVLFSIIYIACTPHLSDYKRLKLCVWVGGRREVSLYGQIVKQCGVQYGPRWSAGQVWLAWVV